MNKMVKPLLVNMWAFLASISRQSRGMTTGFMQLMLAQALRAASGLLAGQA
jgi:hypothetical protein